jgi:Carboxypeptidase regulatory-like domain/TonB dependent receptor-like, beta-barrel/TonB-dependent Receptor Plug Domain
MRRCRCALFVTTVSVLSVLSGASSSAQQAGGSALQGRVIDQQQGVLPGTAIVVTNQDNGTFRETVSGPEGTFFVTGLQPGRYKITADLTGFKKFTREDVSLQLGSTQTVELKLEVGGLTEAVTVSEDAPPVDLTSVRVGGNVGSKELLDLPSPTRNFIAFVAVVPGIQYNPSAEGSDSISVNGQSNNQVTFVLDGGNNTDDNSASASGAQARTPLEAVEEFQVQTNQFDVEFGRTTGGVVNAITKRGTNSFRGSAFGYLTNSAMTGPTILAKQAGLEESPTDKHQYGGTLGGPIIRNKLHFFGSFERYAIGTGLTNVFPSRPDLNFNVKEGLNGKNFMGRVDHQINANNNYTVRYLTERQPNRDLFTGDRATRTTGNYELDIDQTASASYNLVIGTHALNTVRASVEKEEIHRGAEPGTFLENNDKTLEPPVLAHLTFDEQGHVNGQHRTAYAPGLDDTFSWFRPGKRVDHDFKFGFQYQYAQNVLSEQGSMNGVFRFASDKEYNAADPSTYPELLTIRVPVPGGQTSLTHSLGFYGQDKLKLTKKLTLNLGLRYDVDIFPVHQLYNPLLSGSDYPVDKNNFQPRAGFAYDIDGRSVVRGGVGRYYEKLFIGQASPLQANGGFGNSFIVTFPLSGTADPGPSNGRLPTDPMLLNGLIINRNLLNQIYPPGLLTRNTAAVQLDKPDRQMPRSTQVSFGYERQIGRTMSVGADYVHNQGRGWLAYDLNPGQRVNTSRTGTIVRTDLQGLATKLGISPFANSVFLRFDYTGKTRYDGLNFSFERRFSGFWSTRVGYTLGYARGNNSGAPNPTNNFQLLGERNLDRNEGPLDTDRRHNFTVNSRLEVPHTRGLTVSGLFRYMSGRPFTIQDTTLDLDQNGILFDPLPAGTYSGVGLNSISVENNGGRNGAYGPNYAQLDIRVGYRVRVGASRTVDIFAEGFNVTNRSNFTNPSGDKRVATTFLVNNGLVAGGFPRQLQLGVRLGF